MNQLGIDHGEKLKVNGNIYIYIYIYIYITEIDCGVGKLIAVNLKVLQFPQNV